MPWVIVDRNVIDKLANTGKLQHPQVTTQAKRLTFHAHNTVCSPENINIAIIY